MNSTCADIHRKYFSKQKKDIKFIYFENGNYTTSPTKINLDIWYSNS